MRKTCRQNPEHQFEITEADQKFYEKVNVPSPTLCPDCRQQRRLSFRNPRKLYNRKCNYTQREIISVYAPDKPFSVYDQDVWWSDALDATAYGMDFDFQRSFFDQFAGLLLEVPRISLINKNSVNSEYVGIGGNNKNCYLVSPCFNCEDCYYGASIYDCKNTVDGLICDGNEICYEAINCQKSYRTFYCQDCISVQDLYFSKNCVNCSNCIGCYGLRNKSNYIFNQPVKPAVFLNFLHKNLFPLTPQKVDDVQKKARQIELVCPHPYLTMRNAEDCLGDYIQDSHNCNHCFDVTRGEDLTYCFRVWDSKDCYDMSKTSQGLELCYEVMNVGLHAYRTLFSMVTWTCNAVYYCDHCFNSSDLFGCVGLKRNQFCILNKQYTEQQYKDLLPKIMAHMKKTGEWGEFFPLRLSPFGYNESEANEYFPLSKEQAAKTGALWYEQDTTNRYQGPTMYLPDKIAEVKDDIVRQILSCEQCGKNYRLVLQELQFYREMKLPVPRQCPDCRHRARMALRNPRRLWDRKCMKCSAVIQTTYAPDRPEIVYCEKCCQETIY